MKYHPEIKSVADSLTDNLTRNDIPCIRETINVDSFLSIALIKIMFTMCFVKYLTIKE